MDCRGLPVNGFNAQLNIHISVFGEINSIIEHTTSIRDFDVVFQFFITHSLVIGIVVIILLPIDLHVHSIVTEFEHNMRSRFTPFIRLDIDGNLLTLIITSGAKARRHECIITSQGEIIVVNASPSPVHVEHVGTGLITIADKFVSGIAVGFEARIRHGATCRKLIVDQFLPTFIGKIVPGFMANRLVITKILYQCWSNTGI